VGLHRINATGGATGNGKEKINKQNEPDQERKQQQIDNVLFYILGKKGQGCQPLFGHYSRIIFKKDRWAIESFLIIHY